MKKIVALVLSLVMALALCTTAFAADDMYVEYEGSYYELSQLKAGKNNIAGYYDEDDYTYAKCDEKDEGALAVYTSANPLPGDKVLFYVKEADLFFDMKGTAVKAAKWSCTTDEHADGYVDGDGMYWVKDDESDVTMLVGNEIIKVSEDESYIKGSHLLYQFKSEPTSTGVYVYKCAFCGKEFNCAISKAYAGQNYVEYVADESMVNLISGERVDGEFGTVGDYWVKIAKSLKLTPDMVDLGTLYVIGAASADANKGTSSPKTFDAGIAMYVGMSLMSVAGSAVVIGKKKEF